jgi:hypothetical protein
VIYDFEGGPNDEASANTLLALCEIQPGSGNSTLFDSTSPLEGTYSLKMVVGTTNICLFQAWGTGVSGALGTTFGTPNAVLRAVIMLEVPVGGFSGTTVSENTGRNLTVLGQLYGGSSGSATIGRFRTPNKTTVSGATSATNVVTSTGHALINGDVVKPTAIGAATGITVGTNYYVIGKTTNSFQLSATPTGSAITLGTASGLAFDVQQAFQYGNNAATTVTPDVNLTDYEGQTIYLRVELDTGTTNANGVLHIRAYNSAQTAIGVEMIATTQDLGSVSGTSWPITRVRFGVLSTQTSGRTVRWDYFVVTPGGAAVTGTPAYLSFPAAPGAPTANISLSNQYPAVGQSVTASFTGSTAGAGTLTYSSMVTAPNGTTTSSTASSRSISMSVQGWHTVDLVVTQSSGGTTASATTTIYCHPTGSNDVTARVFTAAAGDSNQGGAANSLAALNDALGNTYVLGGPDPDGTAKRRVQKNPFPDGPLHEGISGCAAGGIINRTVNWYWEDSTTLLYTETYALPVFTPAGSIPTDAEVAANTVEHDSTVGPTEMGVIGTSLANRRGLWIEWFDANG